MVYVTLHGGLGNQMFEYAAARNIALKTKDNLTLDLRSLSNKTHEVYTLDKLNIDKGIKLHNENDIELKKIQKIVLRIIKKIIFTLSKSSSIKRHKYEVMFQPILNIFGLYICTDGYIKIKSIKKSTQYMDGYFQSIKYFEHNKNIIKKELKVKGKPSIENKKIINELISYNSVCVHIRRGDYTKLTNHLVCDINYYLKAMDLINEKVKKPIFYIFSDDINWVKDNINFKYKVHYMETNNPNYEELRLMYSCNHFIISNSSFSWWAQYLSENKKKIVISPNIWFRDKKQSCDLILDEFFTIDVDGDKIV